LAEYLNAGHSHAESQYRIVNCLLEDLSGPHEAPLVLYTVSEVEIDQFLIGNARLLCLCFEIVHRFGVEIDGDLFFQTCDVGIFYAIGKIVVVAHGSTPQSLYCRVSCVVALRADMIRMTLPLLRRQ